jgi:DNA polymerase-3 subunit epsilon
VGVIRCCADHTLVFYTGPAADITGDLAAEARRAAMLEAALDRLCRPAAALATLVGVMPDDALSAPMQTALRQETGRLPQAVIRFGPMRDEGQVDPCALPATRAFDLTRGPVARLAAKASRQRRKPPA